MGSSSGNGFFFCAVHPANRQLDAQPSCSETFTATAHMNVEHSVLMATVIWDY